MAGLRLALLGTPLAAIGGSPLRVDTRKAIALLAYLAATGRRHGRDQLAVLLWPDADDAHARAALRRTLSALNAALGEAARVEADRVGLELAAPGLELDVERFAALVAECQTHGHPADEACPACAAPLEAAAALHRGEFMAGFSLRDAPAFEDWQMAQAGSFRRELTACLHRLVAAHAGQGAWGPAIAAAERSLGLDVLDEEAHRQVMRLFAWSGQRGAAIRQYRTCVRVLDTELGVPPLAETTALYQAIVEDRLDPPPPSAAAPVPAPLAEPAPPPAPAPPPLVGRDAEREALLEAWREVGRSGRGRLVTLTGEGGIGKTRLAEDLAARVTGAGGIVVTCRCWEEERLPYGPLADGLRTALGRDTGWSARVAPHWLAEAARLLPELGVAPSGGEGPGAQGRFLEGLCATLLESVAGRRPGLIVLDDLHWADEATLDAVGYLVRRLDRLPVLLVAAWRGERVPRGHPLRRLLADAVRAGVAATLPLGRLDRDAVAELAKAAAPGPDRPAAAGLAAELYERTEGLPLLVVEYLAALDRDGVVPDLPSGARELLAARLEPVPETAWQLLTTAAVIGRSLDPETVREASGRSEDETAAGLEELTRLGLLAEVEGPATEYVFAHEQLRVLVYEQAGLARRRLLHRRVAGALAGRASVGAGPAASIARHYQLAGRDAQAAEWFARAGERSAALYANRAAVGHFRAALALGHPDPGALQLALGDLATLLGEYDAALTAYEAAAARCAPGELPTVEHKLGGLHLRRGDWDAAEAHLEAALTVLGPDGDPATRARIEADRSLTAHRRGEPGRAQELAGAALALAQEAGDTTALAQSTNLLGVLATSRGDHDEAVAHLERSAALAATLPDQGGLAAARNNLALAHRAAGRLEPAIELTTSALELVSAQGDRHREAALHNNLADLFHEAGRAGEAMSHLKQAVAIFAEVGEPGRLQPEIWRLVDW
jgi:DNA-binding SARP family transcriptional activator/tetratricopeptide (TPR) repeat protein